MPKKSQAKNINAKMDVENDAGLSVKKIQQYLAGMDYPAFKDDIVDHADSKEATVEVLDLLKEIPDREYENQSDLMKEVGNVI